MKQNKKNYYIIFAILLLSFYFLVKNNKNTNIKTNNKQISNTDIESRKTEKSKIDEFVIYYFHNNTRCTTCHRIENIAKKVFKEDFKNKYTFKVINVSKKENEVFIKKYSLYTKSIVLVKFDKQGKQVKFNNLSKVWDNIRNQKKFEEYIRIEMLNFLD